MMMLGESIVYADVSILRKGEPMFEKILRQFGYIHTSELIKHAVDIYIDHSKPSKNKIDYYYDYGNRNALNGLFSRLGINLIEYVKRENIKRVYGGHERRADG